MSAKETKSSFHRKSAGSNHPRQQTASPISEEQHPRTRAIRFTCPVATKCGGCQLSRMDYAQQLQWKQKRMETLLAPFCKVSPILGMADPFHYRNKVHAVLATDRRNQPVSGVYAAGTHHVVPVSHCLIEDERADRIIRTITGMIAPFKLRIYNENTHRGFLRHVLIRTGHVTGQIMVVLVATAMEFPRKKDFLAALLAAHPEITTVVLNVNERQTSMVLGRKDVVLYGAGYIEDVLCGRTFRISPQSFYQVNAVQAEVLYRTAIDLAGLTGRETVLDAYCGVGTIGLCASDRCGRLIGVELNPDAVRDAKENARRNGVANAAFTCADAGQFMVKLAREGKPVDVVIMDPPRSGSDEAFLRSVLTLSPAKVVYVSCGPDTLARDLAVLVKGGYRVDKAVPVDMFPCTEHVENVILLSKGNVDVKRIKVDISLEDMDLSELQTHATYAQIKARVKEQTGLDVSNLYIAQVKEKCGIKERANYNHAKRADAKQPVCPAGKEKGIREAFKYFGMI